MSDYQNNSIFWVETAKIRPNPFQPRREFDQRALEDLADSIRQYGVLQPLVVTRLEEQHEDGGISVYYELIAGERRLRAALIAGLEQVPVIIRKETSDKIKLELAIIENLQREDLNPIDRALAFEQLYKEFNLTHSQIGKKMGKSRVYVSNSLRLLSLPDEIKQALMDGQITEGHTRPLLMLSDKPEEQLTLLREIRLKKLSVRDSEKIARSIAQDRVRKKKFVRDPRILDYEKKLSDNLGTRVQIEQKEHGGKITIDYFSVKDLEAILESMKKVERDSNETMMDRYEKEEEQRKFFQKQERESQQSIAGSTPISFHQGKEILHKEPSQVQIQIKETYQTGNTVYTDSFEESNLYEKDRGEDFQKTQTIIENPEVLIEEYHPQVNDEIEPYHQELPEFVHKANEEIMLQKEYQEHTIDTKKSEVTVDAYRQEKVEQEMFLEEYHPQVNDEIEPYHQELPEFVHKANDEIILKNNYQIDRAYGVAPTMNSPHLHGDTQENFQKSDLQPTGNQYGLNKPSSGEYSQNYQRQITQSSNSSYQDNQVIYQNQYNTDQHNQPKKKGFLGKIFGSQ